MRIEDQYFQIVYDKDKMTMSFSGSLRMNELQEFERVRKFMQEAYELEGNELILDFTGLEFMNSAGISTLCKFIFDIKEKGASKALTIMGKNDILWQKKSFENLRKIWGELAVSFV